MNKKIISIALVLSMLIGMLAIMPISIGAATTITITSVDDWMEKLSGQIVGEANINVTATELDFTGKDVKPAFDFQGSFNGNGVVIKNIIMDTSDDEDNECGLFYCGAGAVTFKNFAILDSSFKGNIWCGSIMCCTKGNTLFENIYVKANVTASGGGNAGGFIGGCTKSSNITVEFIDCVYDGTVTSAGDNNGGFLGNGQTNGETKVKTISFTNCLMLGSVKCSNDKDGNGFVGYNMNSSKYGSVSITNCIYAGPVDGDGYSTGYTNYPFTYTAEFTANNCYTTSVKENGYLYKEKGTVYTENNEISLIDKSKLIGANASITMPKDEEQNDTWIKRENDIMIPTGVAGFNLPQWYVEPEIEKWIVQDDNTYIIESVPQWKYFIEQVNKGNTLSGKTVKLGADLVFNTGDATTWGYGLAGTEAIDPVGYDGAEHVFKGTFDGQNHVISGVYMNGLSTDIDMDGIGLFGFVSGATIKNFVLKNSYIKAQDWAGCIVGEAWVQSGDSDTTIENVYVDKDVTMFSTQKTKDAGACVGGFVGGIYGGNVTVNISNCVFAGKVVATNSSVGGFVGNGYYKTVVLDNCLMLGSVVGGENSSGFVGYNTQAEDKSKIGTTTITNCIYAGTGYTSYPFGYFSPKTYEGETYFTIENCYTVTGSDKNVYKVRSWTEGEEDTMVAGTTTVKPTADGSGVTVIDGIHNYIGKSIISSWGTRAGDIPVPSGVKDFAPISFTQHLLDGAAVRLDNPTGLRFKAVLGGAFLNSIKSANEGKEVTYGIIITPEDYITEAGGEFTIEALSKLNYETDYLEINADKLLDGGDDAGYYLFSGVIYDIDEGNYTREFSARAYVKVDDGNGNVTYYYSAYDSDVNSRSIAEVAKAAYEDTNNSETDKYKYEVAENSGVYSPYEATKRALLPSFYEKVATDVYFMSYNIRNVEGGVILPFEYQNRQNAVVSYILSENPDVIGLQEVGAKDSTSWFDILGDEDTQVGLTAKGYAVYVGENTSDDGKSDYNPIYYKTSRFELVENGAGSELLLDENGDPYTYYNSREQKLEEESRGYTYVTLRDKKTGEIFVYVNTHLIRKTTTEGYEDYQDDMARDFAEALKAKAFEYPVIIGGDFNGSYSVYKEYKAEGDEKAYWGEVAVNARTEATTKISGCSTTNGNFDTIETSDGPIDLYFVVNAVNTVIHSYAVTDNKTNVENVGDRYPSDHLPVKLLVTIYGDEPIAQ